MDVGCGPGKATLIIHEMIQPGGSVLGIDYQRRGSRIPENVMTKHQG